MENGSGCYFAAGLVLVSGVLPDLSLCILMGQTLANHSYVDLSLVGDGRSGNEKH